MSKSGGGGSSKGGSKKGGARGSGSVAIKSKTIKNKTKYVKLFAKNGGKKTTSLIFAPILPPLRPRAPHLRLATGTITSYVADKCRR